ncbi:hypothetical protein GCM10023318_31060 [Nocardia callitridis]|uniref:Uncharacterized protein n=1 Tax=Nocardia callitridis TaxID=648753 RepID=A0ABP9KBZ4_9NOCA
MCDRTNRDPVGFDGRIDEAAQRHRERVEQGRTWAGREPALSVLLFGPGGHRIAEFHWQRSADRMGDPRREHLRTVPRRLHLGVTREFLEAHSGGQQRPAIQG